MKSWEQLLSSYVEAGFNPDSFWHITPRLMATLMEGVANRLEREQNQMILLAWQTAALTRVKRMPSLKRLLFSREKTKEPKKEQSWESQLRIAKQWHKIFAKRK